MNFKKRTLRKILVPRGMQPNPPSMKGFSYIYFLSKLWRQALSCLSSATSPGESGLSTPHHDGGPPRILNALWTNTLIKMSNINTHFAQIYSETILSPNSSESFIFSISAALNKMHSSSMEGLLISLWESCSKVVNMVLTNFHFLSFIFHPFSED